jgi:hypothetical protein
MIIMAYRKRWRWRITADQRPGGLLAPLYRFRTRRRDCDLQFGRMTMLGQDRGLCLFASCI